jgi:hypothetical protein
MDERMSRSKSGHPSIWSATRKWGQARDAFEAKFSTEGMGNPKHDPKWFQTWPNRKFQQISHLLLSGICVAQHCYKTIQTLQITLLQARTSKMQTGYKHQAATCCKIPER